MATTTFKPNDHFKKNLVEYLFVKNEKPGSGVATALACDLSGFPWSFLIEGKHFQGGTMEAIISLGGLPTQDDITR